jgi:hypothetical protein
MLIKYIGEDSLLRSILILSKDTKNKLSSNVYKQALLLS